MRLLMLLASIASAQPSHLVDQGFASQIVEIKGVADVQVINSVIVTTVVAQVPVQRSQALMGRFFQVSTPAKTSSTAESPFLLFVNLSTNTKSAYIDEAKFSSMDNSVTSIFRAYAMPVITSSGTPLAINPTYPLAASPSQMQVFFNPTISSNGTASFTISATSGRIVEDFKQASVIVPGATFLVTVEHSANNKRAAIVAAWNEE